MEQYLVQSYFLTEQFQPMVMQYVTADKIEIKDHLVIFYNDDKIIASFDVSQVYFVKIELTNEDEEVQTEQVEKGE